MIQTSVRQPDIQVSYALFGNLKLKYCEKSRLKRVSMSKNGKRRRNKVRILKKDFYEGF